MRKRRANPSKNLIISRRTSDRIPEDAGRRVPVVYRPDRYSRVRSWLRERRAQRILRQLSGAKRTPRISTIAAEIDPITDSYRHTLVPRPCAPGRDYAVFVLSATSIRPVALGFNRFETSTGADCLMTHAGLSCRRHCQAALEAPLCKTNRERDGLFACHGTRIEDHGYRRDACRRKLEQTKIAYSEKCICLACYLRLWFFKTNSI